jgi:hypothetical protein
MPDFELITLPARWLCKRIRVITRSNAFAVENGLEVEFDTGDGFLTFACMDRALINRFTIGNYYAIDVRPADEVAAS